MPPKELQTAKEWYNALQNKVVILDHDGFDRSSEEAFLFSWEKELITEQQFHKKLCSCTIIWDTSKL